LKTEEYPKISIVTPSFNQGDFIETTILSVLEQNYPNVELIVIDAASKDNTLDILKKYERHIKWVSEKDNGQSEAINKGIKLATGDIFNWINSDDYLEKNSLFTIGKMYNESNFNVLCGRLRIFDNDDGRIIKDYSMGINKTPEATAYKPYMCQPATFYKMDVINYLNGVNENLHYVMDIELWMRYLVKYGFDKIVTTDNVLAYFRSHENSKSVAQSSKFELEIENIRYSFFSFMESPSFVMEYASAKYEKDMLLEIAWELGDFKKEIFIALECSKIAKHAYCEKDYVLFKKCVSYIINKTGFRYIDKELFNLIIRVYFINKGLLNWVREIKNQKA